MACSSVGGSREGDTVSALDVIMLALLGAMPMVVDVIRMRRSRRTVQRLHELGMHDAATIARRILLPTELPTFEQLELMKRDGWPGPKE